jgi:hypothetical protein
LAEEVLAVLLVRHRIRARVHWVLREQTVCGMVFLVLVAVVEQEE